MKKFVSISLLLLASASAHADFSGQVVKVADGDTVTVLHNRQQVRVRLGSIDAPEKRQPFGTRSQQHLSSLVFGKTVRVKEDGKDRYGRTIGVLYVDGSNVNRQMVGAGMAWAYTDYLNDKAMPLFEFKARLTRSGLWADAHPVAPWQFRRNQAAARRAEKAQR
ncbi:thermonuclease family protein [Stenotrophomonas sp. YIM B06876]|uniref:thermonuclease family protein n=1 Tax=Stenotrophomonas sp. YIM B06876 TaxID=3060211 RepID=UPI002739153F|nr:thermonuclease family protein [Stenotrophomonas sp. YIM B06876]